MHLNFYIIMLTWRSIGWITSDPSLREHVGSKFLIKKPRSISPSSLCIAQLTGEGVAISGGSSIAKTASHGCNLIKVGSGSYPSVECDRSQPRLGSAGRSINRIPTELHGLTRSLRPYLPPSLPRPIDDIPKSGKSLENATDAN